MKLAAIYCLMNRVNGKMYIGQTCNALARFRRHRYLLRNGKHNNTILLNAWKKHGEGSFVFAILHYVEIPEVTQKIIDELNGLEEKYINQFSSVAPGGYNLGSGGLNRVVSDATRKKLSDSHFGIKYPPRSTEVKQAIRERQTGRKHATESRRKMSAARMGKSPANKGKSGYKTKPASPERKKKIGDAQRGQLNHNFGKPITESTKQKTREKLQGSSCHLAKLNEQVVRQIKIDLAAGVSGAELARRHGVATTQISAIKTGKTWKHVK